VFLFEDINKRYFVNVVLLYEFWVPIFYDRAAVFNSYCVQCLSEIVNGHSLNAQNIIPIEDRLEILCGEERSLWKRIQSAAVRVIVLVLLLSCDVLQTLNDVLTCIWWSVLQNFRHHFL